MSDRELPQGWASCNVREAGAVQLGRQRSPANHYGPHMRPYLRVANVFEDRIDLSDVMEMNFTPDEAAVFQLEPGDILLNEGQSKELVGRPAMYRGELPGACFTNSLVRFKSGPGVIPEYALQLFRYWLRAGEFQKIAQITTNIAHLGAGRFAAMEMPLAPLNEQRRIVANIEELTDRSRRVREALDAIPALLDRFRQSVLASAFRGDLTAEWREKNQEVEPASVLLERIREERRRRWEEDLRAKGKDPKKATYAEPNRVDVDGLPELPEGWCWSTLDQLLGSLRNGIATKPDKAKGLAILRISAVRPLSVNLQDVRYLPDSADFQDFMLRERDLLFTRYNGNPELVGVCGMVRSLGSATVYPDKLIRGRTIPDLVDPAFIELAVNTGISRAAIASKTKTAAGQVGISGGDLRLTPVPLPPLAEQFAIVEMVQGLLRHERAARGAAGLAEGRLDHIDQSILAKAFRGELVPQDPNDEPASVLLERILGERAEAVVPKVRLVRKQKDSVVYQGR